MTMNTVQCKYKPDYMGVKGMKARGTAKLILSLLLAASLCGCGLLRPVNTPAPSTLPSTTATIIPSPESTDEPEETTEPEPTVSNGDIPAFLQAGLPARDKMTDIERWYYYGEEMPDADEEASQTDFQGETTADFDGDGQEETVKLLPGKRIPDSYDQYQTITVEIEGKKTKLTADPVDDSFDLSGRILDIDKSDGKKELEIQTSYTDTVITYCDGKIKELNEIYDAPIGANGTGYILSDHYFPDCSFDIPVLMKFRSDSSGFDLVPMNFYRSYNETNSWVTDKSNCAVTQWDESLAQSPEGERNILIPKGTRMQTGLYNGNGWLQITDAKGNLLGWLDLRKFDFDAYTDYVYQPEGD